MHTERGTLTRKYPHEKSSTLAHLPLSGSCVATHDIVHLIHMYIHVCMYVCIYIYTQAHSHTNPTTRKQLPLSGSRFAAHDIVRCMRIWSAPCLSMRDERDARDVLSNDDFAQRMVDAIRTAQSNISSSQPCAYRSMARTDRPLSCPCAPGACTCGIGGMSVCADACAQNQTSELHGDGSRGAMWGYASHVGGVETCSADLPSVLTFTENIRRVMVDGKRRHALLTALCVHVAHLLDSVYAVGYAETERVVRTFDSKHRSLWEDAAHAALLSAVARKAVRENMSADTHTRRGDYGGTPHRQISGVAVKGADVCEKWGRALACFVLVALGDWREVKHHARKEDAVGCRLFGFCTFWHVYVYVLCVCMSVRLSVCGTDISHTGEHGICVCMSVCMLVFGTDICFQHRTVWDARLLSSPT
jgi:hypothetical protein